MPLHAPLMLRDFLKPAAHRSAPAPAIFDPLRSVFRSTHMLWLTVTGNFRNTDFVVLSVHNGELRDGELLAV